MCKFILSSDSCCDIPKWEAKERNIYRLPMEYISEKDGKITTARDDFDTPEQYRAFYGTLREGTVVKTSQLTVNEQLEYFEKILLREQKDIVHLTLSSGLSGTYDQATVAAKMLLERGLPYKVYVVDSLSATGGQRLLADEAEKMRDEGLTAAQAKELLDKVKLNISHWLIVDDLHHLKRGGRISGAAAAIGTLLNLKPFIGINHEGRLVVLTKNKGVKKSVAKVLDCIKKFGEEMKGKTVYVLLTDSDENTNTLADAIKASCEADVRIMPLGPVIGAHTGPGAFAAAFIGKERIKDLT